MVDSSGSHYRNINQTARFKASQWSPIRIWLKYDRWSARQAVCLLAGLDPDTYENDDLPDHEKYFHLPRSPDIWWDNLDLDQRAYFTTKTLSDIFDSVRRGTHPLKVRTPEQWLRWSVQAELEPPWLKAAYGRRSIARLLPSNLPAAPPSDGSRSKSQSEHNRQAALAKHEKTHGRTKKFVHNAWLGWKNDPTKHKNLTTFANDMVAEIERLINPETQSPNQATTQGLRSIQHATVMGWMRDWNKQRAPSK